MCLDDDFAKDMGRYLGSLEHSAVRSLAELIEFNIQNAEQELPPRQYSPYQVMRYILTRTEALNQDHLVEAYTQNVSGEVYDRHLANFRNVAKNLILDRVFAKYNVNIIIAPADSFITCLASGSGM